MQGKLLSGSGIGMVGLIDVGLEQALVEDRREEGERPLGIRQREEYGGSALSDAIEKDGVRGEDATDTCPPPTGTI